MRTSTAKLETATKQQLVDRINTEAAKIKTLNATVNIATSVGGEKKGKVTEFEEIRGYILVRKPDMLRMIGLFPIVRNKAFDMVSDGNEFKLSIPAREQVLRGPQRHRPSRRQSAGEPAARKSFTTRCCCPRSIPATTLRWWKTAPKSSTTPRKRRSWEQPDYVIDIIHRSGNDWYLARKVVFDRTNLSLHHQIIYDQCRRRSSPKPPIRPTSDYNGVNFPNVIEINRPQEEYSIRLTVEKLVDQRAASR